MHTWLFYLCAIWLAGLLAFGLVLALRRPDTPSAVLAVDTSTLVFIVLLLLVTIWTGEPHALDVALVLGLLSFVQTIAAARLLGRRGLFSR